MNRIKTKGYANLTREAYIMYYFCNRTCVASVDDFLNLLNTQIILLEDDFDYFILDCNIKDNIVNIYIYEEDWSLIYDLIETNNHFILREWETSA